MNERQRWGAGGRVRCGEPVLVDQVRVFQLLFLDEDGGSPWALENAEGHGPTRLCPLPQLVDEQLGAAPGAAGFREPWQCHHPSSHVVYDPPYAFWRVNCRGASGVPMLHVRARLGGRATHV